MAPLVFKLKLKEVPVQILNEQGVSEHYTLREMTGTLRDEYLNDSSARIKFDAAGKAQGVRDFKGMQSKLVSLCLVKGSGGAPVTQDTINAWPASTVSGLFAAAQEINGLKVEEKEAPAKNA